MDVDTVKNGLKAICNRAETAEILVHPCYYEELDNIPPAQEQHYREYQVFVDEDLKNEIEKQGWILGK